MFSLYVQVYPLVTKPLNSRYLIAGVVGALCLLIVGYFVADGFFGSSESSNAEDCYDDISKKDFTSAAVSCRLAADQGDAGAQHNLALIYQQGKGVPQDPAQAVAWFRKAAEQDLSAAQGQLGMMYEWGWGVAQDNGEAIFWYRRAAKKGDPFALKLLMRMYETGRGVPRNLVKAQALYLLAIERGLPEMAQDSDALVTNMTLDEIAEARQMALDCKSKDYMECGF